ncbi:DEAD/DEAH box helicase [Tsukamurella sp. 8F]|uniref:DEAD/DEAH box helicase n=1 Tax=unclassified Tsukamurella TaxID=2633480 RepID=UPI0023B8C625|nr:MULTISPECIES: DEAD/DEAH box helicase [unclassified Tsukamurella]MDF0529574.1 DEAD/DEAH box helicase [Tsukamurella sp. 8J]MDF0585738.1 DEAD/DEAH box helicase [Tsukamurella sp. 8F]
MSHNTFGQELLHRVQAGAGGGESPVTHVREIGSRGADLADWPDWVAPAVRETLAERGIERPWRHQVIAADHAHAGRHVVICTGTASGKSLAYQVPVLTDLASNPRATALYLSPTKALGTDQLRSVTAMIDGRADFATIAPTMYDGDTSHEMRRWARTDSRWVFTNPDMLHMGLLPGHARWSRLLRGLRYIVVDECHHYRGVFGSNTALVLRRLLRVAARYGAHPVVIAASATTANPGAAVNRLIGAECQAVTDDGSPHGARTVALWEPPLMPEVTGENGAPVRRSAGAEAARMMADLVVEGARTLTFVRSRHAAETTALRCRGLLEESAPELVPRVAAYRAGYLAEDRRALERGLADGDLLGVATTNALELGVDIAGLDAVVVAGFPGTVASFWQQAGRSGRRGQGSLVLLVARDDPLDTYLVHHPEALLDRTVEATITDPRNPYVLAPHMLCAAMELPLTREEVDALGASDVIERLVDEGLLRARPAGFFIAPGVEPHGGVGIRGGSGTEVLIVVEETGQLLGTVDTVRAMSTVHEGAVHIHRGQSYVVDSLDLSEGVALVHAEEPDWTTSARDVTEVSVTGVLDTATLGAVTMSFVEVEVTQQVVGYLRTLRTGEVLDAVELELPATTLETRAALYTITEDALLAAGLEEERWPGSLHAAEHAAIGLLPLVASCDRWDIGGLSTALHADTGLPSVFVYDGYDGGAGFAERGHAMMREWLSATRSAVAACECERGCPSCVQSPKCGNGNDPLDKAGAVVVLDLVLAALG